jgi:NAD(P)-dependent dehydrogenase (short-subunit alcohol dehydrogenase family)
MELKDHVAIVTGAGRGIGRATALELARMGADVVIAELDRAGAERTAAEVKALGRRVQVLPTDVTSGENLKAMAARTRADFGRIDILVNNAGTGSESIGPFWEITSAVWDRVFAVNVRGMFLLAKYAYPHIPDGGTIVNMGSVASVVGYPDETTYLATKGAVLQMTRGMACDAAPRGIRVNCICPGACYTPPMRRWLESSADPEALEREWSAAAILNRMGKPEEIARAVLFLASEDSSFMTGEALIVDGGYASCRPGSGASTLSGAGSSVPA